MGRTRFENHPKQMVWGLIYSKKQGELAVDLEVLPDADLHSRTQS
jgi:hypothetical protein